MQTVAADLFDESEGLLGAQCADCDEIFFPQTASCGQCSSQNMKRLALGTQARLWSWTTQHFMPKPPYNSGKTQDTFTAYGVGLVELNCGLIIKSRIRLNNKPLTIGEPMSLHIVPFREEAGGTVYTYEFRQH